VEDDSRVCIVEDVMGVFVVRREDDGGGVFILRWEDDEGVSLNKYDKGVDFENTPLYNTCIGR
jgi:hypothetical protein